MSLRDVPLLVDTNLILEAHRIGCWKALIGAYRVETVEKCIEETQTGDLVDRRWLIIDEQALRQAVIVHQVCKDEVDRLRLNGGAGLHDGEAHLWTHAMARQGPWHLCGPDTASLCFGVSMGHKNRLVHLEGLLHAIGMPLPKSAKSHFARLWHETLMGKLQFQSLGPPIIGAQPPTGT